MPGTITIIASKKVDNGTYQRPNAGAGQKKYLQTTQGGGSPGTVDITETETVIDFGDLASPAIVRIENLSNDFAVIFGPTSGGSMVALGRLRHQVVDENGVETYSGGVALFELEPGVTLRMQVDSDTVESEDSASGSITPTARVQIDAEEL